MKASRRISAAKDYTASPKSDSNEANDCNARFVFLGRVSALLNRFSALQCHVTVKRVEHVHRGFGLGCHIEDYSLTTPQP